MGDVIRALRKDHHNFALALKVMEREVARFVAAGDPDFELMRMVVDYLGGYPDLGHHPKEDLVHDRLIARDPDVAKLMGDLHDEHRRLASLVGRFEEVMERVLLDGEMPRDAFTSAATEFMDFFRSHMLMEELRFFPAAQRILDDDDWREVDAALEAADPLTGEDTATDLRRLAREIEEIAAEAAT